MQRHDYATENVSNKQSKDCPEDIRSENYRQAPSTIAVICAFAPNHRVNWPMGLP